MADYSFSVDISQQQFLQYYRGNVTSVMVTTECGRSMEIDASHFRAFVSAYGVMGRFKITLDNNNRLIDLQEVG